LRFAFLVPPDGYKTEWRWAFEPQADAVRATGATVDPVPWDSDADFRGYDLVLPLVAWGYHQRYGDWLAVLQRLERERVRVANPVPVLRWNCDKAYLAELGDKGVSTVPSLAFASFGEAALTSAREHFACTELVVKPTVSASSYGTFRLGIGDEFPEQVRGWRMLVQPWLENIVDSGEWSLLFFARAFSHCVSKVPTPGEFRVQPEYGGIIARSEPPAGAVELAKAALAAAPGETTYARVDIVVGNNGDLQIIELELIEPALFLDDAPEAAAKFAAAVLSAAERAGE
jgi:glutathione synthase/RimK-type ligase-like ATP-grasp enzyme